MVAAADVQRTISTYANDPAEGGMGVPDFVAGQEGDATFASYREVAWHKLGTVFTEPVTDFKVMAKKARLDKINMRKIEVPVPGVDPEDDLHPQVALVGLHPLTNRLTKFGNGAPSYEIRQPDEILGWAQFGPTDGMTWETAGLMGSTVFGSIAYDREFILDPTGVADVVSMYLMVTGSFDGSVANRGGLTSVRVVCKNTLNIALKGMTGGFAFKSTKNIRDRVKAWQMTTARAEADRAVFEAEAQELFATKVTDATFKDKILPAIKPRPEEDVKGSFKKWDTWFDLNVGMWDAPHNAGIRRTAWGAWNALTEANQWGRKVYKGRTDNFYRAGAGFDNATNTFRTDSLLVVKAFA